MWLQCNKVDMWLAKIYSCKIVNLVKLIGLVKMKCLKWRSCVLRRSRMFALLRRSRIFIIAIFLV